MKFPEIDKRSEADMIQHIKSIAPAYTKEWRFDEENPDVGTALAKIFADMFSGTITRVNQLPEKNMVAFFNEIQAELLPMISASGYVTFGLAGTPEDGVEVPKGTTVIADTEDAEINQTIFETINDVYVIPTAPRELFCTSGKYDYIQHICNFDQVQLQENPMYLFHTYGENIQKHYFYCSHLDGFHIKNAAWLTVEFAPHFQNSIPTEILEKLVDESCTTWEYESEDGFIPFDGKILQDNKLILFKGEQQPPFAQTEHFEHSSRWIRCTVNEIDVFRNFFIDKLSLKGKGVNILPDVITGGGTDRNIYECFPFGEKPSIFSDVYFASDEVLSKKGAQVKLSFNLNFAKVPVELEVADQSINWRLIMKKQEFKPELEYDIMIEEVIWEYYNGRGWARLFPQDTYMDAFTTKHGTMGQYREITFICPDDIHPVLSNSCYACSIRAQVLKVRNAYKLKGNYITPVIDNIVFQYEYIQREVVPEYLYTSNNLKDEQYSQKMLMGNQVSLCPFKQLEEKETQLYLAFDQAPKGGPIRLLLSLADAMQERLPRVAWEYYGSHGWSPLNLIDETENFRKSGVVTIVGARDFQKLELFQTQGYWIRMTDLTGHYNERSNPVQMPLLTGIHMNVTEVHNVVKRDEELFYIDPHQSHYRCKLLNDRIQGIRVEVKEGNEWILWTEVTDFAMSEPNDRHYRVDRNVGEVVFSDDKNGKIPPSGEEETIRVFYHTGGGSIGNLAPNQINRLNVSVGFINQVKNPYETAGGCDIETVSESILRNAAALKHGNRAVTAKDFENLALEASRNVSKAKCFTCKNEQGAKQLGAVTLVLLLKDLVGGRTRFSVIKEQVFDYISERADTNLIRLNQFYVVEPKFLELRVKMEFTVKHFNDVFRTKELVEKKLNTFIDPITGNFDGMGWEIGQIPNRTQILNALKTVDGVVFIGSMFVSAHAEGRYGRTEVDLDNPLELVYALPVSGKHEIVITIEEKR